MTKEADRHRLNSFITTVLPLAGNPPLWTQQFTFVVLERSPTLQNEWNPLTEYPFYLLQDLLWTSKMNNIFTLFVIVIVLYCGNQVYSCEGVGVPRKNNCTSWSIWLSMGEQEFLQKTTEHYLRYKLSTSHNDCQSSAEHQFIKAVLYILQTCIEYTSSHKKMKHTYFSRLPFSFT